MNRMVANNDNAILARLVNPQDGRFSAAAAGELLAITFRQEDVDRMNELAESARDGPLTADHRVEMESYNRIAHFLALVHSKARLTLKSYGSGGQRG